jgi:molecular chaperone GrpE
MDATELSFPQRITSGPLFPCHSVSLTGSGNIFDNAEGSMAPEEKEEFNANEEQEVKKEDTSGDSVNENTSAETGDGQGDAKEPEAETPEMFKNMIKEQEERYMRLYSEFDNYKRRTTKERIELIQTAGKDIIVGLLPVLDDMERALKASETAADVQALREGVTLVHKKFSAALESLGLKPIAAIGEPLDVDLHEAITKVPAPSPELSGKVIDEVEKGYTLNGKVIRFTKAVVGA